MRDPEKDPPLVAYNSDGQDVCDQQTCDDDDYIDYRYQLVDGLSHNVEFGEGPASWGI